MRRAKSLRNSVHHANAVVWEPVYGTHLNACSFSSTKLDCSPGSSGRPSPSSFISLDAASLRFDTFSASVGSTSAMWSPRMRDTVHPSASTPHLCCTSAYAG